jgi:hypothetical protein
MRSFATIAVLVAGAGGISLALNEAHESYAVAVYTSPIEAVMTAALLLNSLATCWLGIRALVDFHRQVVSVHSSGVMRPRISAIIRLLGFFLLATGVACTLYILFAVYLVYSIRSVLPWNDPKEPLALYRGLAVLITSICACWLGVKLMRRRRAQFIA